jgi:hypothetical protein
MHPLFHLLQIFNNPTSNNLKEGFGLMGATKNMGLVFWGIFGFKKPI